MSVFALSALGSGWRKGYDECVGAVRTRLWGRESVGISVLGSS
jgi:hypothetical protein